MFVTKEYNRQNALDYAKRWALDRNPLFFSFNGLGGDCTNFASQCIFAGGCVMNYTPTYGWYYISSNDRTPSWSGVQYLYDFLISNKEQGPFATLTTAEDVEKGDIIQLGNADGLYYHTVIVVDKADNEIFIAAHSDDYYRRPLSDYDYSFIRYLHIEGIRFELQSRDYCFETLINGGIEPLEETQ